jgi:hypothetical protein
MQTEILFVGNKTVLKLDRLKDVEAGTYVNDATVVAQVYGSDGATPVGSPVTLTHVALSNGKYTGILSELTPLVDLEHYYVVYTVSGTAQAKFTYFYRAQKRDRP